MNQIYTSLTRSDYKWLEQKANREDAPMAEMVRQIIHERRIQEEFGD